VPGQHAKLSPSSASRWMGCPASIRMQQHVTRQDEDSVYAREGTIAHALGELEAGLHFKLITKRQYNTGMRAWRKEFDAQGYPESTLADMQEHIRGYVALLEERLARRPMSKLFLEQRLDTGVPTCWGTSDAVIVSPTHVEIIDLKYGAGVLVFANQNKQLRLYGLGALDTYGDLLGETDMVYVTVYQPRLDNVSTEDITPADLRAWRTDEVLPAAELAMSDDAPFGPSEEACRWCPAAGICTARVEKAVAEDFGDPFTEEAPIPVSPEVMTPEQLGLVLTRIPEIKAWCAAVEAHALDTAYSQGQHIPGWKVVMSGGKRYITDDTAAIQHLIDRGFKAEQVANFKAKGIGELEKLVGKKEFPTVMGELVGKTRGKESLVPESDGRPAISPVSQAAEDFKEITA
jgi:hypothetical protein